MPDLNKIGDLERSDPHQAPTCGPAGVEKVSVPLEQWPVEGGLRVELWLRRRDDGGLVVESSLPGMYLSARDPDAVLRDIGPAIGSLVRYNKVTAPTVTSPLDQLEANTKLQSDLLILREGMEKIALTCGACGPMAAWEVENVMFIARSLLDATQPKDTP